MKKSLKTIGLTLMITGFIGSGNIYADGHKTGHSGHKMASGEMDAMPVPATGVIKEVVSSANKIKVQHEPIEAWKMGAMQMTFELAPGLDINSLEAGQKIHFMVKSPSTGKYVITEIMRN
ncbi:copper-binding protein [Motiliproteus sp. MSK22-1]|uniref:copper-binding protein n=1 Tax=Motiliproteus sp. MSK22-1 TaxID=1897630 RepID=UPI00097603B3|nr:copper-binding protein [Motiliproteus sp. MSK22-1]OMH33638.1 hypothetical protein BGP75_11515 [Motiliproteus sp. MSK22-1]